MEREKFSQQEFSVKTGISAPTLSSIFSGRTNPTNNHVRALHKAFPDVNINWLLFGEGEPYLSAADASGENIFDSSADMDVDSELLQMFPSEHTDTQQSSAENQSGKGSASSQIRLEKKLLEKLLAQQKETQEVVRRGITEIRVFFDDGTYETFSPGSK